MHINTVILNSGIIATALFFCTAAPAEDSPPQPAAGVQTEASTDKAPAPADAMATAPAQAPAAEPAASAQPAAAVTAPAAASPSEGPGTNDRAGKYNHEKFNLRFAGGVAFGLGSDLADEGFGDLGGQAAFGLDWVLIEPLALSILATYTPFESGKDNLALQDLSAGLGLRLRLFPGKGGPANAEGGTIAGNLFLDAHFAYHNYRHEDHAGYNIGLGYELALAKRFNLGPYARFQHVVLGKDDERNPNYMMFAAGLQLSVGAQIEPEDTDKDGIPDDTDKCVSEAEDKDGFQDEDGCPDADNDGDGVADLEDKCPNGKGDAATAGCPNEDSDSDGIKNDVDQCPDAAEDKDGVDDEDGCPDVITDKDNDGLADAEDKCPDAAEDKDGFEDVDGCPDTDNDGDGVLDAADRCPGSPESKNGKDDGDGCPDYVRMDNETIEILEGGVKFKKDDSIDDVSKPVLDEIAMLLIAKSTKVRVEGHTDDRGVAKNRTAVSQKRADAVKKYLVGKGVAAANVEAVGLGPVKPLADNGTPEGRSGNNRIEFHLVP
ncbi:MAG: OmpA family protein [Myxococcota bacterium]|jgi:outer membrane protein OmpA-like peptidoglycan-associated protein|nr:OmpA family protein [Myxococcota bacterium]